ncbi:MAG TPA: hypothetical protein VKR53_06755 [Puia sp.]|nr:hypothetical protein [Puia sp.]
MFFPFVVKSRRVLNIEPFVDIERAMKMIQERIWEESVHAARNFSINENVITFTTSFWNSGYYFTMTTIDTGIFELIAERAKMVLKYQFYIGRIFIYFAIFEGLAYFLFMPSYKQNQNFHNLGMFWIGSCIFCWLSTFFGQTFTFKKIAKNLEKEFKMNGQHLKNDDSFGSQ